ncbi:MAG: hypothetical protein II098_00850 [Treponema sp.]|nr:hypothetical protein [Treponema sp.]
MEQYFNCDDDFHSALKEIKSKVGTVPYKEIFRLFLNIRPKIFGECYWQLDEYDEEFSSIMSNHLPETVDFIKNDCTEGDFSWLSEIFDEIVEKTKSKEFVNCIKETAKKFPEECEKYYIIGAIDDAEGYL